LQSLNCVNSESEKKRKRINPESIGVHEKEKKKMGGSYFFRLEFAIWLTKIENTFYRL